VSATDWSILGGTFLGGAFPWLEAIVVIPAGILAGAPAFAVLISGVLGNLFTVWLAAVFGEQIRNWWLARRKKRCESKPRNPRVDRVMKKWGMPGLALLGPLGLGTQISALAAVAVGIGWRRTVLWVGLGTVFWASVAAGLTVAGLDFFAA